jgi:PKD repeat protein
VTVDASRPPVVTAPATVTANVGALLSFSVTASDPDGDAIASLTAAPLPAGATFTASGAMTSGGFDWTPSSQQVGGHAVIFTASNGLSGSATTNIQVSFLNRPPVLTVPASVFGAEGVFISLTITASDPDGDRVMLGALNRPVGSLFVDHGNNSGGFSWTPGFSQAGTYTVTFTGRDSLGASATPRDLTIVVDNVNRGPTAIPGGPYAGVVNVPITFNGTGSADPDGSPLSYLWDFGDLGTAAGVTPVHSYATGGTFTVTLTVGDGSLTDAASTISTIGDIFQARAFTTSSNSTIKLGSGKATWCAAVEPVNSAFVITAVIPSTIIMKYGTGQISAQAGKTSVVADKDANGVQDLTACFAKTDLRTLFAGLPKGTSAVTVTLEGDLSTGGRFRTTLTTNVVNTGGGLAAFLSPNPLNPVATLTFTTSKAGRVSVSIFDLQGRLVRTLEPGAYLGPGYHDVQVDGRNEQGEPLSSGVYFYRVEAAEGTETGQFVIAK